MRIENPFLTNDSILLLVFRFIVSFALKKIPRSVLIVFRIGTPIAILYLDPPYFICIIYLLALAWTIEMPSNLCGNVS